MASQSDRPMELLVGTRAIARFLKIGNKRVPELEKKGAPVTRDDRGTIRAEKLELWNWWRNL